MICSKCQSTELVHDTRDFSVGTASGSANTIYGLTGDYCTRCGEVHPDIDALLLLSADRSWPGRRAPGSWLAG